MSPEPNDEFDLEELGPLERDEGEVRLTDVGNARRFVRAYGHDLRYVGQWGVWLRWDGQRWARDTKGPL